MALYLKEYSVFGLGKNKCVEKNKLILLLRTFGKEEFRQMARFVRSPIYNRHELVIQLFNFLRRQIEGKKKDIDKHKVLEHLFPEQEGDLQELHHLSSYLLRVTEQYLAWAEWQREEKDWGVYQLRAYRRRGLEKPFLQSLKKTRQQHDKQELRNATYYRQQYLLQWEEHSFTVGHGRRSGFHVQELSELLEQSFVAEKLKNACIMVSHQAVSKKEYDTGILEAVLDHVETNNWQDLPAVAINYYSYRALTNTEDDESFQALKTQLIDKSQSFTLGELRDAHLVAINCCIRRLNLRKPGYLREVFDLYRSGLELEIFLTDNQLSPLTYNNITLAGLKLNEFDWVFDFLKTHRQYLPEGQRESSYSYNLARYYYELGDYQQAMPLLMQMENDDLLHNLSAKSMLAKMYYELKEYDALDSLLNSFRTYIYRKEVSYHREFYLPFIGFMNKLVALKPYDAKGRAKLREEVTASRAPEKDWLLKQLV